MKEVKAVPPKELFPYLRVKGISSSENVNYLMAVLGSLLVKNMLLQDELQYRSSHLKKKHLDRMKFIVRVHLELAKQLEKRNEDLKMKLNELETKENKLKEIDAQLEDSPNFSSAASVMNSVEDIIKSFVALRTESRQILIMNKMAMGSVKQRLNKINRDKLRALIHSLIKSDQTVVRKIHEASSR
ncbi:uncharacterized protein [Palaemon carinicauda]|uniref:uncharacterized protein n=1 Tax=Palaemon carinicauda TaxID=392227 RepID=UPI0035B5EC04